MGGGGGRERERDRGGGALAENRCFKNLLPVTSLLQSNKATPSNLFQIVPPTRKQAFKCMSIRELFLFKSPEGENHTEGISALRMLL